jgi:hypothetical protein
MKWLVYAHYRLDTGECFYIGKGTEKRARAKDSRNIIWKRIVAKADRKVIIVERFELEQDALDFEIAMIARYAPVANITAGGEGVSGLKHTEITKLKCRESTLKLRADHNWISNNLSRMREAVAKDESKQKIAKAKKEYFKDGKNRKNMSIKQSAFIKNNPELSNKRQQLSLEAKQTPEYKLLSSRVQGGKDFLVFKNGELIKEASILNQFARENNLHAAAIHKCLKGKQKEHKGYTFRYKESL